MPTKKKTTLSDEAPSAAPAETPAPKATGPKMIQISQEQWEEVQKKLTMLEAVADKGRVFNYENANAEKKPMQVKLSEYNGGFIVGWRTVKDELIKHPTTGLVVGEVQEYELLVLTPDGETQKLTVHGYPAFSEARYGKRIIVQVIGKKEDFDGKVTFDVQLDDGRVIAIDSRFVN